MRRRAVLIAISLAALLAVSLVTVPLARQVASAATGSLEARADAIVAAALKEQSIPGISVAVWREGRTDLTKGYGLANVELDVPADPSTVYRIGSITKQFTAAAIMRLVEAGKLSLDDPIEKHLADFPTAGCRITIRHLLAHTSGIKSYTGLGPKFWDVSRLDYPHEKLVALFKDEPPDFQPGEKYQYNNSGYYLLGMIIEKVTGESYAEHMRRTFFEPLALTSTRYCDNEPIITHRAAGYELREGRVVNATLLSMKAPFSAGALCSNVTDLVAWTAALMNGKVVTRASLEQMTTPATLNDGKPTTYGFGLAITERDGRKVISHGGGINGFTCFMTYLPDKPTTIVVLTNSGSGKPGVVAEQLLMVATPPS
jgi:D-alanyl-D-alanine carboxypeptidase